MQGIKTQVGDSLSSLTEKKRKGQKVGKLKFKSSCNSIPLKQFGIEGITTVKYTLINNLRNLLGPHHLKEGESYWICPSHFYKEPCVWSSNPEADWNEDYCFVEMGL